jgi:signal transduction histidine kinase/DNA-binding NarL/FixJ family response regulator/ligand-binding sensor domain-containing protein
MGTASGLTRFDGIHFYTFLSDKSDSLGLVENYINNIFPFNNDIILITTSSGYLIEYRYSTGKFVNLSINKDIRKIKWRRGFRMRNGEIWYSTDNGVALLNQNLKNAAEIPISFSHKEKTQSYAVHDIVEDESGNFWLGTFTQQLIYFDRKTNIFSQPFYPQIPLCQIHNLKMSVDGFTLFGASAGKGLLVINTKTKTIKSIIPSENKTLWDNITSVIEIKLGELLLGTPTGLIKYNLSSGLIRTYKANEGGKSSLIDNNIFQLHQTTDGVVWISTSLGVQSTNFRERLFEKFSQSPFSDSTNEITFAQFVIQYSNDILIFGHGKGLSFFNKKKQTNLNVQMKNQKANFETITPFCGLLDGNILWVGTWGGGLYRLKLKELNGNIVVISQEQFVENINGKYQLKNNYIKHLSKDYFGNLLVSTWGGGLFLIDEREVSKNSPQIENIKLIVSGKEQSGFINFCLIDSFNNYWISTGDALLKSAGNLNEFIKVNTPKIRSKSDFYPFGFLIKEGKTIILGSYNGIYQIQIQNKENYTFKELYTATGSTVSQIIVTPRRDVWFLSDKGEVGCFREKSQTISTFDLNKEVDGFQPSYGIASMEMNGRLYFSGMTGFVSFHPDSIIISERNNLCRITGVILGGDNRKSVLKDALVLEKINMDYDNPGIKILFSSMNLINPNRHKYRYRLLGSDSVWNLTEQKPEVTYPRLAPGNYTFEAQASTEDGNWNTVPALLYISVAPPFYNKIWFRVSVFVSFFTIIILLSRRKLAMLRKEKEQQENFTRKLIETQEAERAKVARELHDSLGQNLLVLKNLLGLYKKKTKSNDEDIDSISDIISQSIDEVRTISSALHPHQLTRFGLNSALITMIEKVSSSSNIKIEFQKPEEKIYLGPKTSITLYRIIQEGLNNIIKHSRATEAIVSIKLIDKNLEVIVADNGKGFNENPETGSGIFNMKERISLIGGSMEIKSVLNEGTRLIFDHTLFREGLLRIINQFEEYSVIDVAVNGADAEEKILNLKPDIAILDNSMPLKSGIEVIGSLKEKNSITLCVILTMHTEESYLEDALQNGAKGYLLKDSTIDEIFECLQAITDGRYFISSKLTNYLVKKTNYSESETRFSEIINSLTFTEIKVLKLLSQKKTSTQIAEELFISYRTVQKHRQNITTKLGLQGYNQLLFFATENEKKLKNL